MPIITIGRMLDQLIAFKGKRLNNAVLSTGVQENKVLAFMEPCRVCSGEIRKYGHVKRTTVFIDAL
jgi:hypothetical protein